MKRIVISGAGGFLGLHIIHRATVSTSIEIVAITSDHQKVRNLTGDNSRVVTVDTEEFLDNGFEFGEDDVFINCLFPTNADGYRMADGLSKVYKIISIAKDGGVGAFINISSQSVYASKRERPAKEEDRLSLETGYAVGKYCSEMYCNKAFGKRPHTNIRLSSLIGVGYDQRIVNRMIDQALRGEKLNVIGGMQRYGFLDVRDAASGIFEMAGRDPRLWENTYNLGPMDSCTLLEATELIVKLLKRYNIEAEYVISKGLDMRNSSVDPARFMRDFSWKPHISLSRTIEDIIKNKI